MEKVGLYGSQHTRNDGYQFNSAVGLNDAGQVLGSALAFNNSISAGQNTWLFNAGTIQTIGLSDQEHIISFGWQNNTPIQLNHAGHAAGYAERYLGDSRSWGQGA